jgi:hypothetical protein
MVNMYPENGQHENETREEYLKRLKANINNPEYVHLALNELAHNLTKGLEKGLTHINETSKKE